MSKSSKEPWGMLSVLRDPVKSFKSVYFPTGPSTQSPRHPLFPIQKGASVEYKYSLKLPLPKLDNDTMKLLSRLRVRMTRLTNIKIKWQKE